MLTYARARELLDYNPDTGIFTWKVPRRTVRTGDRAGTKTGNGYNQICLDDRSYRAARVAWLWMTGEWPNRFIDHVNRDKADDRWSNLRQANDAENNANKGLSRNNTSGFKGVCFVPKTQKWRAMWQGRRGVRGGHVFLGYHDTPEAASASYQKFVSEKFGQFAEECDA